MAQYSLFVLKMPLNTNKPNQMATVCAILCDCGLYRVTCRI